ncbi:putative homoserine kinase type II [endosymbiont of Riftia pachyptila (vent Ph05)]|uniref:Putative homoserine kinase type II n=1 Tax=endosymbiont of Riftia pachyptila (vent Ph05) TaxID=1048808 RepID=G2DDY5_9GAMM|nr:putative homoserine kinase type II [endosymbiont of Riftia pachyptila (vent Ph05)]
MLSLSCAVTSEARHDMSEEEAAAFCMLSPDQILNAIEAQGYPCDGHLLALNSYENRVYQVGIEDGETLIAKFYRPERWSDKAILEEHGFSDELDRQEIPVVSPLRTTQAAPCFIRDRFVLHFILAVVDGRLIWKTPNNWSSWAGLWHASIMSEPARRS